MSSGSARLIDEFFAATYAGKTKEVLARYSKFKDMNKDTILKLSLAPENTSISAEVAAVMHYMEAQDIEVNGKVSIRKIHLELNSMEVEKAFIHNLVAGIFNEGYTLEQIKLILPPAAFIRYRKLHKELNLVSYPTQWVKPVETFIEQHKQALDYINMRELLNII